MARIPDDQIERLKQEVSLQRLAEGMGVTVKRHGADLIGLCPFHDDHEPSLVISPAKNLWHCLGACQAGGSVIDWVMRAEGVSFRHAVELLQADHQPLAAGAVKRSTAQKLPTALALDAEDTRLLRQVVECKRGVRSRIVASWAAGSPRPARSLMGSSKVPSQVPHSRGCCCQPEADCRPGKGARLNFCQGLRLRHRRQRHPRRCDAQTETYAIAALDREQEHCGAATQYRFRHDTSAGLVISGAFTGFDDGFAFGDLSIVEGQIESAYYILTNVRDIPAANTAAHHPCKPGNRLAGRLRALRPGKGARLNFCQGLRLRHRRQRHPRRCDAQTETNAIAALREPKRGQARLI